MNQWGMLAEIFFADACREAGAGSDFPVQRPIPGRETGETYDEIHADDEHAARYR
jgi:hypothetical protein